jgi:hypothetical protein
VAAGLAWWAACAAMLDWHLGMVEEEDGRPASLAAADACTLARAWLVPVAADAAHPAAVALAAATDVLDGRLARASRTTRAGRDLEGLVDLCFAGRRCGARGARAACRGRRRRRRRPGWAPGSGSACGRTSAARRRPRRRSSAPRA